MTPAQTGNRNHLEAARLTLVATEPVAQVHSTQQASVEEADSRTGRSERLIGEIGVALNSETEDRSEPTANANTEVRIETLQPSVACGLCCDAAINANVDVVECLTLLHCLCRCASSDQGCCHQGK